MFIRKLTAIVLSGALVAAQGAALRAGGVLETINITGNVPSPIAGHVIARVIGIKWDVRSIPVQYRINSTLDPVPNPLGVPVLTVPQASTALQQSLNQWTNIPTSFIEMKIVGTVPSTGLVRFDMVNELSFRTASAFGAIASSPSTALIADSTLVNGDDIDGDGDSDVSSAIAVTTDVDADGDMEFPAGVYKAGTILDNLRPGERFPVTVLPGWTRSGIDLITTRSFNINNFGSLNFGGFTGATPGQYYAVQVPASQVAAITPGELLVAHSVLFNTRLVDASTTPKFADAMLTTGVVNPDGTATLDLDHPLERESKFVGQDDDFSPFFLKRPRLTGNRIRQGVDSGEIQNLFLVLRLPTTAPFPGVSALPPLIGLDGVPGGVNDRPILGLSFTSADGAVFTRDTRFNYMFSLVLSSVPE